MLICDGPGCVREARASLRRGVVRPPDPKWWLQTGREEDSLIVACSEKCLNRALPQFSATHRNPPQSTENAERDE